MGGYFAGLLNRRVLETTLDHETMRRLGSGLGCGAISVITDDCPVAVVASVLAYFDRENAGQWGSCSTGPRRWLPRPERYETSPQPPRTGSIAPLVGGAAGARRLRNAGRRHQRGGQPARPVPDEVTQHIDGGCPDLPAGHSAPTAPIAGGSGEASVKIRLDRTVLRRLRRVRQACARLFPLDDWGYASLMGDGDVPEPDHDAVKRALLDCPCTPSPSSVIADRAFPTRAA